MYMSRKGQISVMVLSVIGLLFSASIGISWNAMSKADKATEEISSVREDVASIKTDVRWIREALNNQRSLGTIATSSPINGHK